MYGDHQTVHRWHQPASPQSMIQHLSRFELRMGKTAPETIIVFKVSKLPELEVTNYMKNIILTLTFLTIKYLGSIKISKIQISLITIRSLFGEIENDKAKIIKFSHFIYKFIYF